MSEFPVQLPLPKTNAVQSAAAFVADMKEAMRGMVEGSGLSRPEFVDAMNKYARLAGWGRSTDAEPGVFISIATLDKLLSDEARGQMPTLWQFEVMARVAESMAGLECWLAMHGCGVLDQEALWKIEFAEIELAKAATRERRLDLKRKLLARKS